MALCNVSTCGKHAVSSCARCKFIKYCSKDCQKIDWLSHKTECSKHVAVAVNYATAHSIHSRIKGSAYIMASYFWAPGNTILVEITEKIGAFREKNGYMHFAHLSCIPSGGDDVTFHYRFEDWDEIVSTPAAEINFETIRAAYSRPEPYWSVVFHS